MTDENPIHVGRCRCGAVEIAAWSEPFAVNACYCDDCQAAAQRLADEGNTAPTTDADGGTAFMLFRRDRIACTRGAELLRPMRLTAATRTRRMIAGCCGTPMYVAFDDKRPWVSAFRARFGPGVPPLEMRICTRFRPSSTIADDGVPSYPGYPPTMMFRILAIAPMALFSRAVGILP